MPSLMKLCFGTGEKVSWTKLLFLFSCFLVCFLLGCRKKGGPAPSSSKYITSFVFYKNDNPLLSQDITTRILNDTIYIEVSATTDVTQLVPTIVHSGVSISPASKIAKNFSGTVLYNVTAADGSVHTYKTVLRYLSGAKQIVSFTFEKVRNPGLTANISGTISGDTILVNLPPDITASSLVPSIVHTGVSISPANLQPADFNYPVYYSVSAEDGSYKNYTVYARVNKCIFAQADDGYLYSINAVNGSMLWRYFSGGAGNYTYHNGIVFFSGADNTVYALNAADGSVKWTSTPPAGNFGLTSPVVKNGKIFFAGSGYLNYPNSNYAYACDFVYAINEETGNKEWITPFGINSNGGYYLLNASADESIVCVYDALLGIFVFDAGTGNTKWSVPGDLLGKANPVIHNNVIYYTNEQGLRAVAANTGTQIWQLTKCYSSPTINGNMIYSLGGQTLYALNLQNGSDVWQVSNLNNVYYTPYTYGNSVFAALSNQFLISYNTASGSVNWQKQGYNGQYLVAANSDLFVCNAGNKLSCLNPSDGTTRWTATGLPNFTRPFCVVDYQNNLFHVTNSGERN